MNKGLEGEFEKTYTLLLDKISWGNRLNFLEKITFDEPP
jgi:hypothetical protein